MSSLAELPELVGFFSYSREDDDAFKGMLSALRDGIQRELSAQLGRSKRAFRLWQDQVAIAPGAAAIHLIVLVLSLNSFCKIPSCLDTAKWVLSGI